MSGNTPGSDATLLTGWRERGKRWRYRVAAVVTAVIVVAIALALPFTPAGMGVAYHSECHTGNVLAWATLWTPRFVLDSPYNGTANATAFGETPSGNYATSGPLTAENGSAVAEFSLNNWTLSALSTVWVLGPGINQACAGNYDVSLDERPFPLVIGGASEYLYNVTLLGPGNTSDAVAPNQITALGYQSVVFGAIFVNNYNFVDGCAKSSGLTTTVPVSEELVAVPFHSSSINVTIATSIPANATYVYHFPEYGGVWFRMVNAFGGLSFEWEACPG